MVGMVTLFLPSACAGDRPGCERMLFGVVGNPDDSTATGLVLRDTNSFSFSRKMTFIFYNTEEIMINTVLCTKFGVSPTHLAQNKDELS